MFNFNMNISNNDTVFDKNTLYDFLIVGGGPAGLNASIYAHRLGLVTGIVTNDIGGQLLNTTDVDNYLGLPNYTGESLSHSFLGHVKQFKIPILEKAWVNSITKLDNKFRLTLNTNEVIHSKTILLATGGHPKKLGIKGEELLSSKGVSYCAICDAPFFKDKEVVVAGGGNSALESALDLAVWAKKVTIIQRSKFRADKVLIDKINNNPKISYLLDTQILEIHGKLKVESLTILDKKTNETSNFKTDGLFVSIGTTPNTQYVKHLVALNEHNEVIVNANQETNIAGIYAAGDMTNQIHKQIIISAAEGAKAAIYANHYLKVNK
ncbi:NAD(P)/FAD-dependent oxidoreductase [Acholeplasma granularum]|uniref:NAD(P)/FAD-dependent oxidoreductase n=1 Tax=Acholeplasma granularum TaxID=264635 RepID=UPI0004B64AE5|nr:FAD-dependent oxidoreductase [Acholeplasma granularum]